MKINILVTGADGQLGSEIRRIADGSADRYIFTDVAQLDITDADAVGRFIASEKIDAVINCAAYTDVDRAETEPEKAEAINAAAVGNLARAVKSRDGVLIHISTDYVFGGNANNTPCREDEPANPTGVYGATKLQGERLIAESGCRHIIIRTAWLYSEFGRNFVKTMLRLTAERPTLQVVFDQIGTPTWAADLARDIVGIVERRAYEGNEGIYHYSNEGVCSWYDFAREIANGAGNWDCDILPCHSSEFPSRVVRPAFSVLDKTKIKTTFGIRIPHWKESLERCLTNILPR